MAFIAPRSHVQEDRVLALQLPLQEPDPISQLVHDEVYDSIAVQCAIWTVHVVRVWV